MGLVKDDFETKIARASITVATIIVMFVLVAVALIVGGGLLVSIFQGTFGETLSAMIVLAPSGIAMIAVTLLIFGAFFVLVAIWRTLERIETQLARQAEER